MQKVSIKKNRILLYDRLLRSLLKPIEGLGAMLKNLFTVWADSYGAFKSLLGHFPTKSPNIVEKHHDYADSGFNIELFIILCIFGET